MSEPVSLTGQRGAGVSGVSVPSHKTACPNSNNPHGHSESCPCRASQQVPYMEPGYEFDE